MQKFLKFASFTSKCVTFISETLQLTFTSLVVYLYCITCNIQKILEKLLLLLRSVSLIFKEKVAIFVGLCQLSTGLGDVGVVLRRLYFVVEERLLKKYFFCRVSSGCPVVDKGQHRRLRRRPGPRHAQRPRHGGGPRQPAHDLASRLE